MLPFLQCLIDLLQQPLSACMAHPGIMDMLSLRINNLFAKSAGNRSRKMHGAWDCKVCGYIMCACSYKGFW